MPDNPHQEIRIDGEIGDDVTELDAVAARVVAGEIIKDARIKSLRALIEAVERHPGAKLAPLYHQRDKSWTPPPETPSLVRRS